MQLVTLADGTPDGRLFVLSRDHTRMIDAGQVASSLREALEHWDVAEAGLLQLADRMLQDPQQGEPFDKQRALAPLPRAWQWLDGSAFETHGELMATAFRMEKHSYAERPLMYQGLSDRFLSATEDVRFAREADGIDFEGEFGVIVDHVPLGTSAEDALRHVRLLVLINDWSLRAIAPIEMKTGFGWIQAKPPCSMAPVAVTPDEIGDLWARGRLNLNLEIAVNGKKFGYVNGSPMAFGFDQLIAHAAHTRDLVAGTIIGSGTVSNPNYREVGSSCITERRAIEMLDQGAAATPFLQFGDRVTMSARMPDGASVFGTIDQIVVRA